MNQEILIGAVVVFAAGWAGARAYVKWKADEKSRVLKATLRNIARLETYKPEALSMEQQIRNEHEARMIAALTAAAGSVIGK